MRGEKKTVGKGHKGGGRRPPALGTTSLGCGKFPLLSSSGTFSHEYLTTFQSLCVTVSLTTAGNTGRACTCLGSAAAADMARAHARPKPWASGDAQGMPPYSLTLLSLLRAQMGEGTPFSFSKASCWYDNST